MLLSTVTAKPTAGRRETPRLARRKQRADALDHLVQAASADRRELGRVRRFDGDQDRGEVRVEQLLDALGSEHAPVGDGRDLDAARAGLAGHLEEGGVHQGLAFPLELEVFELRQAVEDLCEGVRLEVGLIHVPAGAEAAAEVAARRRLHL